MQCESFPCLFSLCLSFIIHYKLLLLLCYYHIMCIFSLLSGLLVGVFWKFSLSFLSLLPSSPSTPRIQTPRELRYLSYSPLHWQCPDIINNLKILVEWVNEQTSYISRKKQKRKLKWSINCCKEAKKKKEKKKERAFSLIKWEKNFLSLPKPSFDQVFKKKTELSSITLRMSNGILILESNLVA